MRVFGARSPTDLASASEAALRRRQSGVGRAAVVFLVVWAVPVGGASGRSTAVESSRQSGSPVLRRAHSHNDYVHDCPLQDALDNKFCSVEADIWYEDGELLVSHLGFPHVGELEDLYFKELARRVEANGSVHGNGEPFYLWLDIKDDNPSLRVALNDLLNRYPMLSQFSDAGVTEGPVTVVLTGDADSKQRFTDEYVPRRASRDSNHFHADDPSADASWRWYALNWKRHFRWRGDEEIPATELTKLKNIVRSIHAKGRKVRFYGAPDAEAFWRVALEVGIDLINTDRISELAHYLRGRSK